MVTLSDGRQLAPDMNRITIKEYRQLFEPDNTQEVEDGIIARVYGLNGKELLELGYKDYRLLLQEFFAAARDPVKSDPN